MSPSIKTLIFVFFLSCCFIVAGIVIFSFTKKTYINGKLVSNTNECKELYNDGYNNTYELYCVTILNFNITNEHPCQAYLIFDLTRAIKSNLIFDLTRAIKPNLIFGLTLAIKPNLIFGLTTNNSEVFSNGDTYKIYKTGVKNNNSIDICKLGIQRETLPAHIIISVILITIGSIGCCGSKIYLQKWRHNNLQNLVIQSTEIESNEINNITYTIAYVPVPIQHTLIPKDCIYIVIDENILTDLEANVVM
jgi:hypothetical protein